jgi:malate dehydrogenase (quinone)
MLDLLKKCFPEQYPGWEAELRELIPTFGKSLNTDAALAEKSTAATAATLGINE